MAAPRYDYSFARRPAWIASHVFVLLCVLVFVRLGLWQLDRLHGRRDANALIEARMDATPEPFDAVVPAGTTADGARDATFRTVTVTGTYRADQQVLIRNRTNEGGPGFWVITPLTQASGVTVAVNRGWVPLPVGEASDLGPYAPPSGSVTVTGLVRDSERREGLGVADPDQGTLAVLSRVDVERLGQQVPEPLAPVWVQLATQDPTQASGLPVPIARPVLDDGSHLNYTGQWFIFATLTVIVYPLLLRRVARNKAGPVAAPGGGGPDADGPPGTGDDGRPDGPDVDPDQAGGSGPVVPAASR